MSSKEMKTKIKLKPGVKLIQKNVCLEVLSFSATGIKWQTVSPEKLSIPEEK